MFEKYLLEYNKPNPITSYLERRKKVEQNRNKIKLKVIERYNQILELKKLHNSFSNVAKVLNLSRQRVDQIVKKAKTYKEELTG